MEDMVTDLLTRTEAAERARISSKTFDQMCGKGEGPRLTRIGGKIFVTVENFEMWILSLTDVSSAPVEAEHAPEPEAKKRR